MRWSRSRSLSVLLAALPLATASRAQAQACCAGASALTPGRLAQHEDALAAIGVKATVGLGSFDGERAFVGAPAGTTELGIEQDLFWTVRVLRRAQVSLLVPFVETYRRAPGLSEVGGGLGDAQIGLRFEVVEPGSSPTIPGIALLSTLTFPTGRPPEAAANRLATDATGAGVYQGAFGVALERAFGAPFVNLTGSLTLHTGREVGALQVRRGPALLGSASFGWAFDNTLVLAGTLTYSAELAPSIGGVAVENGGRGGTRLGLSGGYSFDEPFRVQGSVFVDPPIEGLGKAQPAATGLFLMAIRSWS
jgi:hypothetical protein